MNETYDVFTPESETAEVKRNFATIGAVYADGVSLIFDGEETATEKHYLCNTNVFFAPGDRVRILADSGTYIVEYVVGPPRQEKVVGIPAGGDAGTVLTKATGDDHDVEWTEPSYVPTSGTTGYVLTKTVSGYDWEKVEGGLPSGGNTGDFLKKTSSGTEWAAIHEVPASGTTGYVLTKTATGYVWQVGIPTSGTTGHVLTKTASGYAWQAAPTEIPTTGTTGYVLAKTSTGVAWQALRAPELINPGATTSALDSYDIQIRSTSGYTSAAPVFEIRMKGSATWHKITTT